MRALHSEGEIAVINDPRFAEGIQKFNDRQFFQAHQIWERIWLEDRGPKRDFYKGLIQIALCLHHFNGGNTRGARKLYISCQRYLNDLRPKHRGVDLDRLMTDLETCCAELLACQEETPQVKIDLALEPQIAWDSTDHTSGE
jgi:predicted metal-dependent hydrolase